MVNMDIKIIKVKATSQNAILKEISEAALASKFVKNVDAVYEDLLKREKSGTTGFEKGVAIPHARNSSILKPAIIVARFKKGVDWKSLDGKLTDVAIAIMIPGGKNAGNEHMAILARVASSLMETKNIDIYKTGTLAAIKKLIHQPAAKKQTTTKQAASGQYDVVAVTTCPTGVAHTNMAADALEKYAAEHKIAIKVERQAAQGRVNNLTDADIAGAKYVILAAGKQIEDKDRFAGKKVYETKVVAPIKNAKEVFEKAALNEKVLGTSRQGVAKKAFNQGGAKPMQALMAGVSYMIPFVVIGGLLIAISLGVGGHKVPGKPLQIPDHSFWAAINGVGSVGFTLMIPILGGFIASAIAGRGAIAPAMVLSFVVGNGIGDVGPYNFGIQFWNWSDFEFGHFHDDPKLGFFGSIAVGFAIGYAVKAWNAYISKYIPKALKPVEPIIFIPLLMTVGFWVLFTFFIYVPIYWISQGLNDGISALIDRNLFFIAALIIGGMISFDMGGPINKIAFLFAGGMIANGKPEVMGAAATAIAIPPLGCGISILTARLFGNRKHFDEQDRGNAVSAIAMSLVGITEGAIPFAVKFPKQAIIANVVSGALGAGVASLFVVTDLAMHGGPIVYIVGAIGKNGVTDYLWGLFFLMSILVGAILHAIIFNLLFKIKPRTKKVQTQQKVAKN